MSWHLLLNEGHVIEALDFYIRPVAGRDIIDALDIYIRPVAGQNLIDALHFFIYDQWPARTS